MESSSFASRNKDGKPELDFEMDEFDIRMPDIQPEDLKKGKRNFPGPQRSDQNIPEMDYSLRVRPWMEGWS